MCLPSDPVCGKVGDEAQNFPEAAILDVAEVEKVFPRLIFLPLQGCPNSPGTEGSVSTVGAQL